MTHIFQRTKSCNHRVCLFVVCLFVVSSSLPSLPFPSPVPYSLDVTFASYSHGAKKLVGQKSNLGGGWSSKWDTPILSTLISSFPLFTFRFSLLRFLSSFPPFLIHKTVNLLPPHYIPHVQQTLRQGHRSPQRHHPLPRNQERHAHSPFTHKEPDCQMAQRRTLN